MNWLLKSKVSWVVLSTTIALLVIFLDVFHTFTAYENSLWDLRERTFAHPSQESNQIDVVLVDQSSLDWVNDNQGLTWPWDRTLFGAVTDFFTRSGVKALVFDVIFSQPSAFGGSDQTFGDAITRNGRVIMAEETVRVGKVLKAIQPTDPIGSSAALLGHVYSTPDSDGINRRMVPTVRLEGGQHLAGLSLAAWSLGTGKPLPKTEPSRALLRYRGPQKTYKTFSFAQILNSEIQLRNGETPQIDPKEFSGKYVFIGFSAQGLMDLRPSPLDPKFPGVEVHATYLDNLLAHDTPQQAALWLVAVMILLWSWGLGWLGSRVKKASRVLPLFVMLLLVPLAAGWTAYAGGWWWPIVAPLLAGILTVVVMLVLKYAGEGRDRRFIEGAFGQYLSAEVVEQLVKDPSKLQLGGEKRCLSIFFSDVAGFTSISERLDPVGLTNLLNEYLTEMTQIIYDWGGTIDKYEGDAIIAFWNAPLDLPDHAARAVQACLAYQKRLTEIRPRLEAMAGGSFTARVGLNSGDVVIGNMGSRQRFNYTFLGDAGNLASRLEGINKVFGSFILVSEFTRQQAGDIPGVVWRELGRVRVVGKSLPVTVFEPLNAEDAESRQPELKAFSEALQHWYRGNWNDALVGFEAWETRNSSAAKYAEQTRNLMVNPPRDWDGVWNATEK